MLEKSFLFGGNTEVVYFYFILVRHIWKRFDTNYIFIMMANMLADYKIAIIPYN